MKWHILSVVIGLVLFFLYYWTKAEVHQKKRLSEFSELLRNLVIIASAFGFYHQYTKENQLKAKQDKLNFLKMTSRYVDIHKMAMRYPELDQMFLEMKVRFSKTWPKQTPKLPENRSKQKFTSRDAPARTLSKRRKAALELHISSMMFQLMEDVYVAVQLDENYRKCGQIGWMNTFHNWLSSKTVRQNWSSMQRQFGAPFQIFVAQKIIPKQPMPSNCLP